MNNYLALNLQDAFQTWGSNDRLLKQMLLKPKAVGFFLFPFLFILKWTLVLEQLITAQN